MGALALTNNNKTQPGVGAPQLGYGNPAAAANRQEILTVEQAKKEMLANARFVTDKENFRNGAPITRPVTEMVQIRSGEVLPSLATELGVSINETNEFTRRVFLRAQDNKISVSEMLDLMDPQSRHIGTPEGELDAFDRQLVVAGIRVKSNPAKNQFADKVERFETSNIPGSQVLFPEWINRVLRIPPIAQDILGYLVDQHTQIVGGDYRTIYLDNSNPADRRMYRIGEGADIPKAQMKTTERAVPVGKYGRGLEGSYEAYRRIQIDKFQIFIQQLGMQSRLDRATTALYTLVNGDGNGNAAVNWNQSVLDTGVVPTYAAFLDFQMKFYPYVLGTMVGSEVSLVKFLTMTRPNIDPLTILALFQNRTTPAGKVELPQEMFSGFDLILSPDMPDGVFLGLVKGVALEEIMEAGSSIVEIEQLVSSQRRGIYATENVAYAKIMDWAAKTWTWNA